MSESKNTEQLILEAAVKEFAIKGFDGARTTAIASAAGVTHAMLHYYFRSKENLFERIFKDKIRFLITIVFGIMNDSSKDIITRIKHGISRHFDFLLENPELPLFFVNTMSSRPELFTRVKNELQTEARHQLQTLQTEFDRAAEAGQTEHVNVPMLIFDMVSLNIFPFLTAKPLKQFFSDSDMTYEDFMHLKKIENIKTIIRRIQKPQP